MSDPIDLSSERKKRQPDYVDVDRIEAALTELEGVVGDITFGSVEQGGGVDVLAHEISAHINAIRRAVATEDV